jgi:AbrB family looped-hinge helix DNA binding protein
MTVHRARIAEGGRMVIPVEFRRKLGLQTGAYVILDITDGELRVRSLPRAIERAQALVRSHVPEQTSLADELIRDRRAAATLE